MASRSVTRCSPRVRPECSVRRPKPELRGAEQQAACAAVGVTDLVMLDHPDGMLVYSLDLRRAIAGGSGR